VLMTYQHPLVILIVVCIFYSLIFIYLLDVKLPKFLAFVVSCYVNIIFHSIREEYLCEDIFNDFP